MAQINPGDAGSPELPHRKIDRWSPLAVVGLALLMLVPVWCLPVIASHDGPSHLYNATVLNESIAGDGPSTNVYQVEWDVIPNCGGPLLLMGLLKVAPFSVVPRIVQTITCVVLVLALLLLRAQAGRSRGLLWVGAVACCLATGRAWVFGFESFSVGLAGAILTICLWQHWSGRLDILRSLALAVLLNVVFFMHLISWGLAVGTIAMLALMGPMHGRRRRIAWTAALLLTAAPCLLLYMNLRTAHGGGLGMNWEHLQGFHPAHVRSWGALLFRVDCVGLMRGLLPFTGSSSPWEHAASAERTSSMLAGTLGNPFVLLTAAVVLQALGTLRADIRSKEYRHIGRFIVGVCGIVLATFMPDASGGNGSMLPFRVMLFSLILLVTYVRVDLGRWLTCGTSLLVGVAWILHSAAIWDYTATMNSHLVELRDAAATIPPGQRIYHMRTKQSALRFRADPMLHCDGYVAVWSRGVLLSNYEAGHFHFPLKIRPPYPRKLFALATDLNRLRPNQDDHLVVELLSDYGQFIDVLIVHAPDKELLSLAQRSFDKVLWHQEDLWILARADKYTMTAVHDATADNRLQDETLD